MRNRDVEAFLRAKQDEAPLPELSFDAARAATAAGGDSAVLPGPLSAKRSRMGMAGIAAAAAVLVVAVAVLALWKLPEILPALWNRASETSESGDATGTSGGMATTPTATDSTASQTEAAQREDPIIDLEAIKADMETNDYYEDYHVIAHSAQMNIEGHFTRKDVLQTAHFLFYMENGMGGEGDVWHYLCVETPGEETLQLRCLDNLVAGMSVRGIRDVTGDGLDEFVLLSYGKGEDITILSVADGTVRPLIATYTMRSDTLERNFGFTVEFLADYKAVLRHAALGFERVIDLSAWKEFWRDTDHFEEDSLIYGNAVYFWFVDNLEILDGPDGEPVRSGLEGAIQWHGAYKTTIGTAVAYLSYDAATDSFVVTEVDHVPGVPS